MTMPNARPVDPTLLIAGFRGAFYWEGQPFGAVTDWGIQENWTNSDTQPQGVIAPIPVTQSVSFTLNFTEITIDDTLPATRLRALREGRIPVFRFVGEVYRPDGSVGRYVCNACVPDGTQDLIRAAPGDTMTRAHSYRIMEVPDIDAVLGA
jgi:hypothetical protein